MIKNNHCRIRLKKSGRQYSSLITVNGNKVPAISRQREIAEIAEIAGTQSRFFVCVCVFPE